MLNFPKGTCIACSPTFYQATYCVYQMLQSACPQGPDQGDKTDIHAWASTWYKGPDLGICANITSCLVPTNSFHSSVINLPEFSDRTLCYAHHVVPPWRGPLPLLNLSFRTQDESRFLLKIFSNLCLGWIRLPSSEPHHINVCTCPRYDAIANVLAHDQKHLVGFYTAQAQDSS